ncbi:hypothetical protein [Hymenobacter sp. 102]|uniref:hypothetical protein n=1 Tax=Hymenobacter sp. 102 TaxID=3403152 RepID=UPI003CF43F51
MPSFLSLTPRPDLHTLVARWTDDGPTLQLQQDYANILAQAQQHRLARWLLDVRRRDQLNPELGQWTTHVFYPQAATQLAPQHLRIAVLCSPGRLAVYEADPAQQQYLAYGLEPGRNYDLRLFIEEGHAMEWLQGSS